MICASEDVGMADSNALVIAQAAASAVHMVGMPEARIILAHAAVYVAKAPKSNAAYRGINKALEDVAKIDVEDDNIVELTNGVETYCVNYEDSLKSDWGIK